MGTRVYGRWGGPGYSDGHCVVAGERINFNGRAVDSVDEAFRAHDQAYDILKYAWLSSDRSPAAINQYWQATMAADQALINSLAGNTDQSLSAEARAAGAAALAAFAYKQTYFNVPAWLANADPGAPGSTYDGTGWGCKDDRVMPKIKSKVGAASSIPSPIILDLDGDGVETIGVRGGAYFDHAADGFAEQTGWVGRR